MVDHHGFPGLANLMAEGRRDGQLTTGLETEVNLIQDAACHPAILGHPCDDGETHAGGPAHDIKNRRHRVDLGDEGDV
jgi:hypothetical protein